MTPYLPAALEAARAAGSILERHYRRSLRVSQKSSPRDLVTDVDRACERAILRVLRRTHPAHRVLAEESAHGEHSLPEDGYTWVVDPLDGTMNYIHGIPFYCTSIALCHGETPQVGVVHAPALGETFTAIRGRGARLNGRPIRVTSTRRLRDSFLVTGFPYDLDTRRRNNLREFQEFMKQSRGVRRVGTAALDFAYVAQGSFDGFWELALYPWDCAAGALLVEEAGGQVSDLRGRPFSISRSLQGVVATNRALHAPVVRLLRRLE